MNLITLLNFNKNVCTYNMNGQGIELINASQYSNSNEFYKRTNSHKREENEKFVLIGDGNFILKNENLIQEIAYFILLKVGTSDYYALKSTDFYTKFVLIQ